jgi:hypothetical protein
MRQIPFSNSAVSSIEKNSKNKKAVASIWEIQRKETPIHPTRNQATKQPSNQG